MRVAHADAIQRAKEQIRADKVNAAISTALEMDTVGEAQLWHHKTTKTGTSTVKSRVADLLDGGLLEKRGGGPTPSTRLRV